MEAKLVNKMNIVRPRLRGWMKRNKSESGIHPKRGRIGFVCINVHGLEAFVLRNAQEISDQLRGVSLSAKRCTNSH